MTYRGIVKDGVVHLQPAAVLADGTEVEVMPFKTDQPQPNIFEKLGALAGQADGLPPDLACTHGRYSPRSGPECPMTTGPDNDT